MSLGQSAGPHTVWMGIEPQEKFYVTCPRKGVTFLKEGKDSPFCPSCGYRLAPLTNLITDGVPEYEIQEKEY